VRRDDPPVETVENESIGGVVATSHE
jgi:hypothetical protein